MATLRFRPFSTSAAQQISPWFADPETQRRLGDTDWAPQILRLTTQDDDEVAGRHAWTVADGDSLAGLVCVEVQRDGHAWLALVVAPDRRGRGIGERILRGLADRPELDGVQALNAAIERDSIAAQRCLRAAGFETRVSSTMTACSSSGGSTRRADQGPLAGIRRRRGRLD